MTIIPAIYAAATFISTFVGGLFALRFSRWMDRIMAFSGGVLLAAGLLDLMPESIVLSVGPGPLSAARVYPPLFAAVLGFLIFYLLERTAILRSYHSHHHHPSPEQTAAALEAHPGHSGTDSRAAGAQPPIEHAPVEHAPIVDASAAAPPPKGVLGAAGLCVHSLLDGFSIGVAFHASAAVGALVGVAIIAHDFSDGVSTVTLILSGRNSRAVSLAWLAADALAPLVGVAIASWLTVSSQHLGDLLGAFAGMFLYLGATHLLPEAHAISDSFITVLWMVAGVLLMVVVTHALG